MDNTSEQTTSDAVESAARARAGVLEHLREHTPRWLEASVDLEPSHTLPAVTLLRLARDAHASDVHVSIDDRLGARVSLRIHGTICPLVRLGPEQAQRLQRQLRVLCGLSTSPTRHAEQGHATIAPDEDGGPDGPDRSGFDVRLSAVPTAAGASLSIRLMPTGVADLPLDALGLTEADRRALVGWFRTAGGLMLIVGPTGSGKTTTLYSLLRHAVPQTWRVVTVEQPVESSLPGIDQIPAPEDRPDAIVSLMPHVLRQDPDVVVIGEILDADTARAAVRASLAGRGVIATGHAPSAAGAVTWLRHCGAHDFEIAETLGMVVAQRLVRVLCDHCKRTVRPGEEHRRLFEAHGLPVPEALAEAVGCDRCGRLGYTSRTGVFDVWLPAGEDPARIRQGQDQSALSHRPGRLMRRGLELAAQGRTSIEEVLRHCPADGVASPA
ncbi:MAG: type II secretion system protein GspE [Phycisphaerales bacterium]|nr:MAG: type II secretion system protein GspE [Phycisphaerales bacterium]